MLVRNQVFIQRNCLKKEKVPSKENTFHKVLEILSFSSIKTIYPGTLHMKISESVFLQ